MRLFVYGLKLVSLFPNHRSIMLSTVNPRGKQKNCNRKKEKLVNWFDFSKKIGLVNRTETNLRFWFRFWFDHLRFGSHG